MSKGKKILACAAILALGFACCILLPTSTENLEPVIVEAIATKEDEKIELEPVKIPILGLTVQEIAYGEFIYENLEEWTPWSIELGKLLGNVGEDPYLMFDEDWIDDFATALFMFELYPEKLAKYENVPDRFMKAHEWLIMINSEAKLVVSNLIAGIDNIDAEKIEAGNKNLVNMIRYLNEFTKEFFEAMP